MASVGRYEDLRDRTVIVTGASSGIGLAAARAFLAQGSRVVLHGHRHAERLRDLASDRAVAAAADLATERGCESLVRACLEAFGRVDVLVHGAGIWKRAPIREITAAELDETLRINLWSAFFLAREAARAMASGSLLFVGSTAGLRGEAYHSHYAATKGALVALTYSLAEELAPEIRVNLVAPGWVRTPMTEEALRQSGDRIAAQIPLRRIADPDDVAGAILFLASDAARYVTGEVLSVSGGALIPMPRG